MQQVTQMKSKARETPYNTGKVLLEIEKIGKSIIPNFEFSEIDREMYTLLIKYFFQDPTFENVDGYSLNKGLFIQGNVGVGKSLMMKIFRVFNSKYLKNQGFAFYLTTDVIQKYQALGEMEYSKHGSQCFRKDLFGAIDCKKPIMTWYDDLGVENNTVSHFGNTSTLLADILLKRYDMFISYGMRTIICTNLSGRKIENIYGIRVRSRMREMMNYIFYPGDDRRK
jgi:hypothetical protein